MSRGRGSDHWCQGLFNPFPSLPASEFPELSEENQEIWNANAAWWDDRICDGNEFQTHLIEPASERLLAISPGDHILDIACGAGRFARRMAILGGHVIAIDHSTEFVERARIRTASESRIEYHSRMRRTPPLCSFSAFADSIRPCALWRLWTCRRSSRFFRH